VALVTHFLVARALELARAALDRALHVVLGHALRFRFLEREAQTRIRSGIAASGAGSDRDLADQFREDLAALGVLSAFSETDIGPLAVTGHVTAPSVRLRWLIWFGQSGVPGEKRPQESPGGRPRGCRSAP